MVKMCHDGKNVTRLGKPWFGWFVTQVETCHDYLNRATILGAAVAYLSWRLFWKQGLRFEKSKVRFWDYKTARRAISSPFYHFMYVFIPLMIMLFVNTIMSS